MDTNTNLRPFENTNSTSRDADTNLRPFEDAYTYVLAIAAVSVMAAGGSYAFLWPWAVPMLLILGAITAGAALSRLEARRAPYPALTLAMTRISSLGPFLMALSGAGVYALAGMLRLDVRRRAVLLAAIVYTLAAALFLDENANLLAVWAFLVVWLSLEEGRRRREWYLLAYVGAVMVLVLRSRGAVLAAIVGLAAWHRPQLATRKRSVMAGALLIAAIVLTFVTPRTSARRLDYWAQSFEAWQSAPAYPWLGIGAGKLSTVIVERGKGCCMPHAHNVFVSTLAEGGLVSAALLLLGLAWWWASNRARLEPWQIGLAAALIAWSLVDEPLYFPGPLMVSALLLAPHVANTATSDGLR